MHSSGLLVIGSFSGVRRGGIGVISIKLVEFSGSGSCSGSITSENARYA